MLEARHHAIINGTMPHKVVVLPAPQTPTMALVEAHRTQGHPNFEPWCEECVRAKAPDDAHRRQTLHQKMTEWPLITMDFAFMGSEKDFIDDVDNALSVILAMYDETTGAGLWLMLPNKRITDYVVSAAARWIDSLCHGSVKIRSDNEGACKVMGPRLQTARLGKPTKIEYTPRYSSQSKGGVENFIKNMKGQTRAMMLDVGLRYACEITCQHAIFPWLVRAVGYLWTRYHIKTTGSTPFFDLFQEDFKQPMLPFGETVLFRSAVSQSGRLLRNKRQYSGDPLWHRGIYLGRTEDSHEHLIGTDQGCIRCRSVRRLHGLSQHDKTLLNNLAGTPWNPILGVPGRPPQERDTPTSDSSSSSSSGNT